MSGCLDLAAPWTSVGGRRYIPAQVEARDVLQELLAGDWVDDDSANGYQFRPGAYRAAWDLMHRLGSLGVRLDGIQRRIEPRAGRWHYSLRLRDVERDRLQGIAGRLVGARQRE